MELIERDDLLSALHTIIENVTEGEGRCVFINGEAGIGKTALVKAFSRQHQNNCRFYIGGCDALFTPRPLAPLYDILWQVNKAKWPASPGLADRSVLFADFFQELSTKSETCVIVFEDIHWADEGTLDFIKFFARRIAQLHCLFILTYRDNEILPRHPLRNVLGQLPPDVFIKLNVTALSKSAVTALAAEKGYSGEDVFGISGGNPFYVNEILASYSPGIPENIKDSILAVYERQEEGTRHAWQITSVVPEGLELEHFAKLRTSWDEAMDHCFAINVIMVQNSKVVFKHELYRRTIEASLSPFKRIALNKKILEMFLESFEKEGQIERIVHYAKHANENKLVVQYAPIAAWKAVNSGAHVEAAKLFRTAIEYADNNDEIEMAGFYEAYAYECYLTSQINDAIIYQSKALDIWQKKNNPDKTGDSHRFLSRLWSVNGDFDEAEKYGRKAVEILAEQPSSIAKGLAFSNMAKLSLLSEEIAACIAWGNKAIKIADEINDRGIVCHALNSVGAAQWAASPDDDTGKNTLQKSLEIALQQKFHEHAARAYTALICNSIDYKDYSSAKTFLASSIAYCETQGLDASRNSNLVFKARILLETGNWEAAASIAKSLVQDREQPGTVKINSQLILSVISIRKAEPGVLSTLMEVKSLALKTKEYQRILPVIVALLEYEWLVGKKIIDDEELTSVIALVIKVKNSVLNSEFDFWMKKARKREIVSAQLYEPYQLLKAGKITAASNFWKQKGCPFNQALALYEGDEADKKLALSIFQQLGADAIYEKAKMEMRAIGIKKIPRGLRESTKLNPAQLTNREIDILKLLQKGIQSKEIAGTLFISPKTASHHISNIFLKLDVNSRSKAVMEAVRLGVLN